MVSGPTLCSDSIVSFAVNGKLLLVSVVGLLCSKTLTIFCPVLNIGSGMNTNGRAYSTMFHTAPDPNGTIVSTFRKNIAKLQSVLNRSVFSEQVNSVLMSAAERNL